MHLERGQVSFEILLLTTFVIAVTIAVSGYYLTIRDSTVAMQLSKTHALDQIERTEGSYTLSSIDFEVQTDSITMFLETTPATFNCELLDGLSLSEKIRLNTTYPTATIQINSEECAVSASTCPDGTCGEGENCPADVEACSDNICKTPTCISGCAESSIVDAEDSGQCDATTGCAAPPCICNTSEICVQAEICSQTGDEDGDGTEGCADDYCNEKIGPNGETCQYPNETTCADNQDNDGDSLADCDDTIDCGNTSVCQCTDNSCDPGDNCPELASLCDEPAACNTRTCVNGCNNPPLSIAAGQQDIDGDNLCEAPGYLCDGLGNCTAGEVCSDLTDNDGDGKVDCADSDCHGLQGPSLGTCEYPGELTCNDGYDNDADGTVDCADMDCISSADCSCIDGLCDDGDNCPLLASTCDEPAACTERTCVYGCNNPPDPIPLGQQDTNGANQCGGVYLCDGKGNCITNSFQLVRAISLAPGTPMDNYQINVLLDSSFNYESTQANGEDIRFYAGMTKLNYWVEEWTVGGDSSIWVKVPTAGTTTFDMRYNNLLAQSESNGTNVFEFFDDFEDGDVSDWSADTYSTLEARDYEVKHGNYSLRLYGSTYAWAAKTMPAHSPGAVSWWAMSTENIEDAHLYFRQGTSYVFGTGTYNTYWGVYVMGSFYSIIIPSYSVNTWYKFELRNINWTNYKFDAYVNGSLVGSNIPLGGNYLDSISVYGPDSYTTQYYDDIYTRKYVEPNPVATLGIESLWTPPA